MLGTRIFFKAFTPRTIDSTFRFYHVCVLGGASEIGQVLNLMLRAEPSVSKLVVHDTGDITPGVVIELSHIPVKSSLRGYLGNASLTEALRNSDIVLLAGGLLKTPGVSDKACLEANTDFVKTAASHIGRMPKMPFVGIVTEPINTLVPMAAEVMRNMGTFDSRKIFGVTTIDWLRAQTLFATQKGLAPEDCFVPVIGGHSDKTAVPLVSKAKPVAKMTEEEILKFVTKLQNYDETITQAKHGKSPTVSIAYGVLMFARQTIKALDGLPAQVNAYVENNDYGTSYFSSLVHIDAKGVKEMARYTDNISQYECLLLDKALVELRNDVALGKKVLEVDHQTNI